MKTAIFFAILGFLWINLTAQTPQAFKYQAVVRDGSGSVLANKTIFFKISIMGGSAAGTVVYREIHAGKTTNVFGLVDLEIGKGAAESGTFTAINWASGSYFVKVEIFPSGATEWQEMGTSQILSIPYALYAKDVQNKDDADADPTNEIQTLSLTANNLSLSKGGGMVAIPGDNWGTQVAKTNSTLSGQGTDASPLGIVQSQLQPNWNNINGKPSTITGFGITDGMSTTHATNGITSNMISNWNTAFGWGNHAGLYKLNSYLPVWSEITGKPITLKGYGITDADTSNTNELQTLNISGTQLTLSKNGGTVSLPSAGGGDNWGSQIVKTSSTLTGQGTDASPLGVVNSIIAPTWNNIQNIPAGFADGTDNVEDNDADPANEIQTLGIAGSNLSLSKGGGSVVIPGDNWGSQGAVANATLTGNGTTASPLGVVQTQLQPAWNNIQGIPAGFGDGVDNVDDADADPTNEIQTLSINVNQLTLSKNGGTITLPASGSGDNWGTQTVITDATLAGTGTTSNPLKIADNGVTSIKIADNSVQTADLADNTVISAKIVAGAVTTDKLASGAVTTDKISNAAVTGAKIAQAGAVGGQVLKWDGTTWLPGTDQTGAGALPGGANGQVQFNNAGSFGGDAAFTWDNTNKRLGIGTATPTARLQVVGSSNGEGNVLFTGSRYLGDPPASGAGTRMMWYLYKGAFRAGGVGDTSWDKDSIGIYSVAFGFNTKAKGTYSFTTGTHTSASGDNSVAFGEYTSASGRNSIALGSSTIASGYNSVAAGGDCEAQGWNNLAMGSGCNTSGTNSFSLGSRCTSSNYSFALGYDCKSAGLNSLALGSYATTSGNYAIAIGNQVTASAGSVAMGWGTTTSISNTMAVGVYNVGGGSGSTDMTGTDPLFEIGNGTYNAHHNAITVLKNGNVGIGTSSPIRTLHLSSPTVSNELILEVSDGAANFKKWDFVVNGGTSNHQNLSLRILNDAGTASTKDVMTWLNSGNIGIGTTTPEANLEIKGTTGPNIIINDNGGADRPGIQFKNNPVQFIEGDDLSDKTFAFVSLFSNNRTYDARIQVHGNSTSNWGKYIGITHDGTDGIIDTDAGDIGLRPATGRVGIGTNSPTQALHVEGNAYKTVGGTSWALTSDFRLKDIHGNYNKGLSEINELQPVRFTYKTDNPRNLPSKEEQIGFVAQAVQKIFPEAVTKGEDGYFDLSFHAINVALVNAVKELKTENDRLKAENEKQQSGMEALESRLAKLERLLGAMTEK